VELAAARRTRARVGGEGGMRRMQKVGAGSFYQAAGFPTVKT